MEPTYWLAKAIIKPWFSAWFKWSLEGLENIPAQGGALLAFNHIAYLDPLAAAYVIDKAGRRPRFLGKAEIFDDKRVGWILKGAGQIPVARGTADAPMALDQALAALDRGEVVVVFPEGTITDDPDLNPTEAKTGIARLALAAGVPVIPCALWGTANVWGKGYAKRWWPGQDLCLRIGEPILVSGDATLPADWKRVGAEVMDAISLLVASLRAIVPDRRRSSRSAAA